MLGAMRQRVQTHTCGLDAAGLFRNLPWALLAWIGCIEVVWIVARVAGSL